MCAEEVQSQRLGTSENRALWGTWYSVARGLVVGRLDNWARHKDYAWMSPGDQEPAEDPEHSREERTS